MSRESHGQPPQSSITMPGHPHTTYGGVHPQYQGAINTGSLETAPSPLHSHLQHQSKSFPPRLTRTPSVSSQSSLDSAPSRTSVSVSSHSINLRFTMTCLHVLVFIHILFIPYLYYPTSVSSWLIPSHKGFCSGRPINASQ